MQNCVEAVSSRHRQDNRCGQSPDSSAGQSLAACMRRPSKGLPRRPIGLLKKRPFSFCFFFSGSVLPASANSVSSLSFVLSPSHASAFAKLVPGEITEPVIGSVLISFTKRRVVEDLLYKFVDGKALVQNRQPDMNQLRSVFSNHANPEQFLVCAREN